MQQKELKQNLIFVTLALISVALLVDCDRQNAGRRQPTARNDGQKGFKSNCGTADQVSALIGKCLEPIFDLVEGKFQEPTGDKDLIEVCGKFNATEKCVRQVSKDCLSGVHKTSTGAIASATKRFRSVECKTPESRGRYSDPLKCALRKGKASSATYKNHTAIAQAIRDIPNISAEEKILKVCCLFNQLDREVEREFNNGCPKSTPMVLGILHAMTDDARSTLCRNPKCDNALHKLVPSVYKQKQNLIEPVMQILFMITVE